MPDTFATLRADFFARGFDYMNDAGTGLVRTKALLNNAYLELCEEEKWPFLVTASSGTAPHTITDVREIETVQDQLGRMLYPLPAHEAVERFGAEPGTDSANPDFYWMTGDVIYTHPPLAAISVVYYKVPAELVADADQPVIPNRFRRYIVEGMVRVAAMEDSPEVARAAEAERQLGLNLMRRSLLFRTGAPQYMRVTSDSLDS